jgi:hypothetical protein
VRDEGDADTEKGEEGDKKKVVESEASKPEWKPTLQNPALVLKSVSKNVLKKLGL